MIKKMKDLLEQLQSIYNEVKDENEIAIIEKYSYYAKCYTVALLVFGSFFISALNISQFWMIILDVVVPKNESRPRHLLFAMEYFLDNERYTYLALVHFSIAYSIGVMVMVGVGTIQITIFHHAYGMFEIASYRIEHAAEINIEKYNLHISSANNKFISKGINCAVDMHRQAMKLSKLLIYIFETSFFWLIVCGVGCLSLNLLRIAQIDSFIDNAKELMLPSLFTAVCVTYMFLANYCGQVLTDHNNLVFTTAYNVQWYAASLHTQKVILILLQRGNKEFFVSVGGLFIASMECFASLTKASVSYFTVIYSTR